MLLSLKFILIAGMAALAVYISLRVMKTGTTFPVQTGESDAAADYMDVPRGIVTGTLWAGVLWSALFTVLAAI